MDVNDKVITSPNASPPHDGVDTTVSDNNAFDNLATAPLQPDPSLADVHLLVVDDDDRIRSLLKRYLSKMGFRVSTAANAEMALDYRKSFRFDVLILDVMMPGQDGFSLTKTIRKQDSVPIILLTARAEPTDRLTGLRLGADDYLSKPFEPEELVLRIKAILKRQAVQPPSQLVSFGPWIFDQSRKILLKNGANFHCTTAEIALLEMLAARVGVAVPRQDLSQTISAQTARAVDVQITRLRRKIEEDPAAPSYIITVRNKGYKLQAEPVLAEPVLAKPIIGKE